MNRIINESGHFGYELYDHLHELFIPLVAVSDEYKHGCVRIMTYLEHKQQLANIPFNWIMCGLK